MADKKISALTAATTPLAGTEVLPIVQSSSTVKVAVSNLTAGRAVNVGSLTSTGNILLDGSGNPTITLKTSGAGNNPLYRIQADTNYWDMIGIFSNADDPFRIRYNDTDFFQIANTGGVSIGNTTDPGAGSLLATGYVRGGAVYASSGYVNETQTISTAATVYSFNKDQGAAGGSSATTFNITGIPNTDGSWALVKARASNTAAGINATITIQANGTTVFSAAVQNTTKTAVFVIFRENGNWVAGAAATGSSITTWP